MAERAMAFELGHIRKFRKPRGLRDYGLTYAPQSFVYLNE